MGRRRLLLERLQAARVPGPRYGSCAEGYNCRNGGERVSGARVIVVGAPSAESDRAVARFMERYLEGEHPGTAWRVRERAEPRVASPAAPGEAERGAAGGVDDDGAVAA